MKEVILNLTLANVCYSGDVINTVCKHRFRCRMW